MRVISKSRLKQFWESPGNEDSEGALRAWYTHVSSTTVAWHAWRDVKTDFATASAVGNCVVFNVRGNNYRLIARILYPSQKVFILKVMPHREYDKNKWKEECGCYSPPPNREKAMPKSRAEPQRGMPKRMPRSK